MNVILWVLQVLLAVAFFAHGWLFLNPPANLVEPMRIFPTPFRLFLGVAEVAAAVGLTLPGLMRRLPGLVPLSAAGLMIVMIGATIFHIARSEFGSAVTTAILLVLLTYVAYMRWRVRPIPPRAA